MRRERATAVKAIVEAGPGKELATLYRARVFQSEKKLIEALKHPDLEIGPPPSVSAVSGRMNAPGISVFYGATSAGTALAEVRPPVGSRVAIARFELIRPVRLLDVELLREVFVEGSIFDDDYIRRLERAKFLGTLSRRMTRPVMPDDEPFDFLVTQVIAEYLSAEMDLDGMVYPSAQVEPPNSNVVLFHRAARMQSLDLPAETKFTVQLEDHSEDGTEVNYTVWEEFPQPRISLTREPLALIPPELMPGFWFGENEDRLVTLKIELTTLQIHHVVSAKIKSEAHSVTRHQSVKSM